MNSTSTLSTPLSMALSPYTLRFTSTFLLTRLSPFLRPHTPTLRFSSTPRLTRKLRPSAVVVVSARKREDEDLGGQMDVGNGNVVGLKDKIVIREGRVVATELHREATDAYMAYAMSVLLGRALPDVRDGLKPVHRRILYAMHELGLSSRKPYKKCARVVGEVLGKFHPHGDSAVYDSLVRMAQDFSLRSPLIGGHGNFGSIDADPAAAMRYTECRLEALTEAMLIADLDQDTVEFVPNFDSSQKEPAVLPARLPNLLLNGAYGIAPCNIRLEGAPLYIDLTSLCIYVGMATNIPPHNLGELTDVLCTLIHNPDATVSKFIELLYHLKLPISF